MRIKILIFIYYNVYIDAHTQMIINVQYYPETAKPPYSRNSVKHFMNKITRLSLQPFKVIILLCIRNHALKGGGLSKELQTENRELNGISKPILLPLSSQDQNVTSGHLGM